jgi:putative hydrolase of the HAD superfamily
MSRIEAVVLDLDDTLYAEREYAFSGFAAVAQTFSEVLGDAEQAAADMRRLFDTANRPRVFNALLAERGMTVEPTLVDAMVDEYRRHTPTIHLYPDAERALTRLREGRRLGLITDGPVAQQWRKLDALGLRDRLDVIIVTAELGPAFSKPHSAAFELIADRLSVDHAECAYLADNPAKDFIAPNALGWLTIRVIRAEGVHRDTPVARGGAAQQAITSLDEVDPLLD